MKLLFALSDRDLLFALTRIFEADGAEVTAVFDGIQAVSCLAGSFYDAAVLDRSIPRVEYARVLQAARESRVPAVLLTETAPDASFLLSSPLPAACLAYPFSSEELAARLASVTEKSVSDRRFTAGDREVAVAAFSLGGRVSLTDKEIDLLLALAEGEAPAAPDAALVRALNDKYASLGSAFRIRYFEKKGYRLVAQNE